MRHLMRRDHDREVVVRVGEPGEQVLTDQHQARHARGAERHVGQRDDVALPVRARHAEFPLVVTQGRLGDRAEPGEVPGRGAGEAGPSETGEGYPGPRKRHGPRAQRARAERQLERLHPERREAPGTSRTRREAWPPHRWRRTSSL